MTDEERYRELLDLLSRGLIRYAEKHGQLERSAGSTEGNGYEPAGQGGDGP